MISGLSTTNNVVVSTVGVNERLQSNYLLALQEQYDQFSALLAEQELNANNSLAEVKEILESEMVQVYEDMLE